MADIIGSGIAFPLRVDARGGLALVERRADVREAIGVILGTAPGERPMRPEFGCGVHDYVFDVVDAYTVGRIEHDDARARSTAGSRGSTCSTSSVDASRDRRGQAADRHPLRAPGDERRAQPRLSLLRHPRRGAGMRLPDVDLDDRRFQDLVNEARLRITQTLPRVDRAQRLRPGHHPDRAVRLDDRDAHLPRQPDSGEAPRGAARPARHPPRAAQRGARPSSASASPRRRTSRSRSPAGETEVGTLRTASEEAIVFQTDEDFAIPAARPRAYVVERGGAAKDVGVASGTREARRARTSSPFGSAARGRRRPLPRLRRAARAACCCRSRSTARRPAAPASTPRIRRSAGRSPTDGAGGWAEAEVLADTTGGFNYGSGIVELQLPDDHKLVAARGPARLLASAAASTARRARARRRRSLPRTPPEIYEITAGPDRRAGPGARTPRGATSEILGESDGTPGQVFELPLRAGPRARGRRDARGPRPGHDDWERWAARRVVRRERPDDRHFTLDLPHGEVEFGPAIRTPDGGWRQYGAVPPKGAAPLHVATATAAAGTGTSQPATLNVLKSRDPRRRDGHESRRRRAAASTPETLDERSGARRDGDPHALPRGDGGGLRVPRGEARRRSPGRLRAAAGRRARSGCTSCRAWSPPTGS